MYQPTCFSCSLNDNISLGLPLHHPAPASVRTAALIVLNSVSLARTLTQPPHRTDELSLCSLYYRLDFTTYNNRTQCVNTKMY